MVQTFGEMRTNKLTCSVKFSSRISERASVGWRNPQGEKEGEKWREKRRGVNTVQGHSCSRFFRILIEILAYYRITPYNIQVPPTLAGKWSIIAGAAGERPPSALPFQNPAVCTVAKKEECDSERKCWTLPASLIYQVRKITAQRF